MKQGKQISLTLAMSAMTFDSSPFPVAKLSLYSACLSAGGGSVWQMGKSVFFWLLRSPSHLNHLLCNLHDLWIEFKACLERCSLKRRSTDALSDLKSRTYAGVEPISYEAVFISKMLFTVQIQLCLLDIQLCLLVIQLLYLIMPAWHSIMFDIIFQLLLFVIKLSLVI